MPVTVVVGGQYGSEGKGKVAHYLAQEMNASVAIRCGGPNSGHTVINPEGKAIIFQQLPTASILPSITSVLCAGSYIDLDILLSEIKVAGLDSSRLLIDPNAVMITADDKEREKKGELTKSIGSTGSGTGEAVVQRIRRQRDLVFAKDVKELSQYVRDTKSFLRVQLDKDETIIVEGTQGYGLSLLHSEHYPYVTSRDTTAAGFIAEAGLSPLDVDDVVLVIRAFPIRVGGDSGPLPLETDWQAITTESGSKVQVCEHTSVTKKLRRVARFDPQIVKKAIQANQPTRIVLNHLDYVDATFSFLEKATLRIQSFVSEVERVIAGEVSYFGFGPGSLIKNEKSGIELVYHKARFLTN
jgi:adenylosuccinate synthase